MSHAVSHTGHPRSDGGPSLVFEQDEVHARVERGELSFVRVFLENDLPLAPLLAQEAGPSFDADAR